MLIGEYQHTLDAKKRLAIPAKWRRELGRRVVVTYGLDHCLAVYPLPVWHKVSENLAALSTLKSDNRNFHRFIFGGAVEAELDSLGRVLIPDFLKDYAALGSQVVMAGMHNRVEIWAEARWQEFKGRVAKEADALAEKLSEVGLF